MELRYYKSKSGNFGDDLNPHFFDEVAPRYRSINKRSMFGIGTLLNESKGLISDSIIFGSGYGQGAPPKIDFASTTVLGVRGPVTANALALPGDDFVMGDPALYLPKLSLFDSGACNTHPGKIIVALHHKTSEALRINAPAADDCQFLEPSGISIFDYIATIRSARLVLAEAMHAAIVAAAYGIPFIRVGLLNKTDVTKWKDFLLSLHVPESLNVVHSVPFPNENFGHKIALSLARRGYLGLDTAKRLRPSISSRHLESILSACKKIEQTVKPIPISSSRLSELQSRCAKAVDVLNQMAESQAH